MASRYRTKYNLLIKRQFLPFEAREFARNYTTTQLRKLPYLKNMIRWRSLYVANFRSRGYSNREIISRIYALYDTRNWLTDEGQLDPWKMLKRFRQAIIDSGGDPSPGRSPTRGSHHKAIGVSKGDIAGQKQRRKKRLSDLERYDIGRGR